MPLFTVSCRDKPDSFDLRARTREAHLAWVAGLGAAVKAAGPWMDGEGRSIGTLAILEADDVEAAGALVADDPYAYAGLFASVAVEPWRLVTGGFT